jgi:fructose-bisphosphate aldolase class II
VKNSISHLPEADHTHSLASAIEAAEAGFDSIGFDLSALPFEENVRQTRTAVEALKAINPAILIEGEIGDIGTGSEIHDAAPDLSKGLTTPEEAKQYVDATGVDILAPAVGNMHGMIQSMVQGKTKKRLDLERITEIKSAIDVLITLHGASGTNDEDLRQAIAAGINIVHINTELRVAWRHGLEEGLAKRPQEVRALQSSASRCRSHKASGYLTTETVQQVDVSLRWIAWSDPDQLEMCRRPPRPFAARYNSMISVMYCQLR